MAQFPIAVIKSTSNASRFGVFGIFKFALKHWFIISTIFFLLPSVIASIQIARETNNPSYPFVATGLTVINADNELNKEINILREKPVETIGIKPDNGIWNKTKYYWNIILIYWQIIGLLFLILVPFKLIYMFYKYKGDRAGYEVTIWENLRKTIIAGVIFITFVNLVIIIVGLSDGSLLLKIPETTVFQKVWFVIVQTFPFHGVWNLGSYLIKYFT